LDKGDNDKENKNHRRNAIVLAVVNATAAKEIKAYNKFVIRY
jgi:hypothetical protein